MIKFIRNYPLTSIVLTILIFIEFIFIKDIITDENRMFSFYPDLSINGFIVFWKAFNLPILVFFGSITPLWFITTIDDKLRNKNTIKIDLTKDQKNLIKQIHKRKITDFETLIIEHLKPTVEYIKILDKKTIGGQKMIGKFYVFDDPQKILSSGT